MHNLPHLSLLVFGLAGQALFSARFLIQWLVSEHRKESVIPIAFWYLSLAGGVTLLTYAVLRHDPVFVIGQSAGLVVYMRNVMLLRRCRFRTVSAALGSEAARVSVSSSADDDRSAAAPTVGAGRRVERLEPARSSRAGRGPGTPRQQPVDRRERQRAP